MATITKSFTENQVSDMPKATWTVSLSGADYSVTETGQIISVSAISGTAKYVGSSKGKCIIDLTGATRVTGNNGSYYGGSVSKHRGSYDSPYTVASGTTFSLLNSSGGNFNVNASNLFTSLNPTEKTKAITFVSGTVDVGTYNSNHSVGNGYYGSISFSPSTLGTITYNCPPVLATCSISKDTSDYYTGLTRATFNVPITYSASGTTGTAKYGGYIKKIEVGIGSQTETLTFDESTKPTSAQTLSIDLSSAGTFTPTITVTDSRDKTATQTLADITVHLYNVPSANFDVYRSDASGAKSDEGHYALIQSAISYTDAIATLTEPSIQIDGVDLSSLTDASVTWYKTWSNTNGVSNVISDWTTLVPQNHMVTIYGLIDWDYDTTGKFAEDTSYQITLVANDSVNGHSTPITQTMSTAFYTIDFQAGGKEIALGAPANDDLTNYPNGLFKCDMDIIAERGVSITGDLMLGAVNVGTTLNNKQNTLTTETWSPSITRSTGGTISNITGKQYGKLCMVSFVITYNTSVGAGNNLFTGTLSNNKPVVSAFGAGYYGSHDIITQMSYAGTITVRNASASAVTVSDGVTCTVLYLTT